MIVIVAGFGRCGSSLLMQMLDAGGIPGTGQYPGFEPDETNLHFHPVLDERWLRAQDGKAIKLLDPQLATIPPVTEFHALWCERDHNEQAKSSLKMVKSMFPDAADDRAMRRRFARSFEREKSAALKVLRGACGAHRILEVQFEEVLSHPLRESQMIAAFLDRNLNVLKMAKQVVRRPPEAMPNFAIELMLIDQRGTPPGAEKQIPFFIASMRRRGANI